MQFKRKFVIGCFDLCYQYSYTAPVCLQQISASRRIFTLPKQSDQSFSKRYNSNMVEKVSKSKSKKKYSRRKGQSLKADKILVDKDEVYRFILSCLEKGGATKKNALHTAANMAEADYKGHFCHGISKLEMYVNDLQNNRINGYSTPEILSETSCTAWVDGHNGLGASVGNFCMKLAIDKAQDCGIGWVVAKGCNNYGMPGWYATMAQEEGLLGISFTNLSPAMGPMSGKNENIQQPTLHTNSVAVAMPGSSQDRNFILDFSSKVLDLCKIQMKKKLDESIPKVSEQDSNSINSTEANTPLKERSFLPSEGSEKISVQKGYGVGVLLEILSGVLSGSDYCTNIRKYDLRAENSTNLGQCFIVVDPARFAPGYKERMSDLMEQVKHAYPNDPDKSVLIDGEEERMHMQKVDEEGGIKYHKNQIEAVRNLAEKLKVEEMALKVQ